MNDLKTLFYQIIDKRTIKEVAINLRTNKTRAWKIKKRIKEPYLQELIYILSPIFKGDN